MENLHGVFEKEQGKYTTHNSDEEVETITTYEVNIICKQHNKCPVPNCTGESKDKFGMHRHFCLRHVKDKLIIAADGELPRYPLWGVFVKDVTKH